MYLDINVVDTLVDGESPTKREWRGYIKLFRNKKRRGEIGGVWKIAKASKHCEKELENSAEAIGKEVINDALIGLGRPTI